MQAKRYLKLSVVAILAAGMLYLTWIQINDTVIAQLNSPKGSATTMIGNVTIPGVTPHVKYNNVSSSIAFNKENITAPISPTGISTQAKHLPVPANGDVNSTK